MIKAEQLIEVLPPFLQEFMLSNNWTFRDSQVEAFNVLLDTKGHLLLSAGTSSGKTEAALFPVITSI